MPDRTDPPPPAATSRGRRIAIRAGIGLASVLVLFVLVVFVLPTPLARYFIESQLETLGIQHDGIDTVEIDLWDSRVRAGPVRFHSGEAPEGQIGETGFHYSFGAIFEGRAFVQTFYLRGVDLRIARLEGGALEFNGINLQDLAAGEKTAAGAPPSEEEEGSAFEMGVERFEFTNSQLFFKDVSGGTLTIEVERLTLDRLLAWTPEQPTTFELDGRLNEIDISFDGTVTPLGDPLLFTFNSRASGITLDRVARFVGPIGLERQDGTLDTEVHYAYAIHRDGRVEGSVDGTYSFSGFDIVTTQGERIKITTARMKVDLEQQLLADGSAAATGQLRLEASPISVSGALGDSFEIGGLDLTLDDLNFRKGVEERRRLWASEAAGADAGALAEKTPSLVDLMIGWARELGQDALRHNLSIDGQPSLTLKDVAIGLAARGEAPARDLRFAQMSIDLGTVVSEAFDEGFTAAGALETMVTNLKLETAGAAPTAAVEDLRIASDSIKLRATTQETTLAFDLEVLLEALTAGDAAGGTLVLDRLSLVSADFAISETAEREEASGPLVLNLEGLAAGLPGAEGDMTLRGDSLDLILSPFTLTGKGAEAGSFDGSLEVSGLSLERSGASPLSASLTSTRTDLQGVRVAPLGPQAEIEGGIETNLSGVGLDIRDGAETLALSLDTLDVNLMPFSLAIDGLGAGSFNGGLEAKGLTVDRAGENPLSVSLTSARSDLEGVSIAPLGPQAQIEGAVVATNLSGISLEAGQGPEALSLTLDTFDNEATGLQASGLEGGNASVTLANHTRLRGLAASLPLGGGETVEAAIAALEAPLSELAFSGRILRAKGGVKVTALSAATKVEPAQSLDIASLSVTGFAGDSGSGAEIESIALGELMAKLSFPLPEAPQAGDKGSSAQSGAAAVPDAQTGSTESAAPFDKRLKLGSLTLAPGSRIEITDGTVEPPFLADILLQELIVGPVDTGAPETRTDLSLALVANETAKLNLHGWVAPLKAKPDFELTSRVETLSLPPLSPYAAEMVGVNIESGALIANVEAKSANADLLGNIALRIDDLFVTPLSDEDAEKLQSDIGLPVGFAVSILKDSEGIIGFGLPLSGTLDAPQVDYSEAINKAVTGAMASVFPTNWFGPDGNTFKMQPAPFLAGTATLTEDGKAVADDMGGIFAEKPGLSIRACGRAGRDDLLALRGVLPEPPAKLAAPVPAPAPTASAETASPESAAAAPPLQAPAVEEVPAPSEAEVAALLTLAKERGAAVRQYLEASYGIEPTRIPECRTAYSIKDGKPPRAEFQF